MKPKIVKGLSREFFLKDHRKLTTRVAGKEPKYSRRVKHKKLIVE